MMKSYYITVIYILLIDNIFAAQLFDLWSDYDPEEGELGRIQICKSSSRSYHLLYRNLRLGLQGTGKPLDLHIEWCPYLIYWRKKQPWDTEWTALMGARAVEASARPRCSHLLASGPWRSTMDWVGMGSWKFIQTFNSLFRERGCGGQTVPADGHSEK